MMETFNELLKKMHEAATKANDCLSLLQSAFMHNSSRPMKEYQEKINFVKKAETEITVKIAELARENHALKPYLSIPHLLSRTADDIDRFAELVNKKIKDDILFSDRAISEITILLQRLTEILKTTADLFITNNPVLIKYVQDAEADVAKKSIEFATSHEERMIEGLCLPLASPLFLNMLNAIRCIARDAKEISAKFADI